MAEPAVVGLLRRLVAHPTISSRPILECAADVAQRCADLGFRVERFVDPRDAQKASVIASIGPEGTDGLVISGHMDVVPVEGQPWTTDPFVLTERDGRLHARGSADMKGFIAATLVALARIAPGEYRRELVLIWTHDEEVGCLGSAALATHLAAIARPLPTDALIGEPTSFQILRMHPGHVAIEVDVHGKAAHSSRPDLGINAIEGIAKVVRAVEQVAAELAREPADLPELPRPIVAVNVAEITGGTAINIVPDHARVRVGYRPLPGQDPHAVFERIRARVADLALPGGFDARVLRVTPAMLTPRHTPLEHCLAEHAHTHEVGAASFATDGGNLAKLGMRPLVFGPGDIDVAHKADEFVPTAELVRAVDIVEQVVRRHCCGQ
ncbi:MAG: acetylornithine deacetylase [Alphaproteobacteria bacterium]|nr:acetylornithine deacetylase [Alphaproteobacteria bacterium]